MTFLQMLVEAVNAVAEWPQYWARVDDCPVDRTLGYRVASLTWHTPAREIRHEVPHILRKRDQLVELSKAITLPLRPYPEQQREREILARRALLTHAVYPGNIECRRETAHWITFLGRLRAAPDGSLIQGWRDQDEVRPEVWP